MNALENNETKNGRQVGCIQPDKQAMYVDVQMLKVDDWTLENVAVEWVLDKR